MAAVEYAEVLALLIGIGSFIPVVYSYFKDKSRNFYFYGFLAFLIGLVLTVAESFVYPVLFNYLEHGVGIFGAALLFLLHTKYYSGGSRQ